MTIKDFGPAIMSIDFMVSVGILRGVDKSGWAFRIVLAVSQLLALCVGAFLLH